MKVTAILEKPEGQFEFTAELSSEQHNFLLEYAIRDLISKGLLPFSGSDEMEVRIPDKNKIQ